MLKSIFHGLKSWFTPLKALYTKGVAGHGSHPPVVHDRLLQEDSFPILQEDGAHILIS